MLFFHLFYVRVLDSWPFITLKIRGINDKSVLQVGKSVKKRGTNSTNIKLLKTINPRVTIEIIFPFLIITPAKYKSYDSTVLSQV